jgi:hypothetical protein
VVLDRIEVSAMVTGSVESVREFRVEPLDVRVAVAAMVTGFVGR